MDVDVQGASAERALQELQHSVQSTPGSKAKVDDKQKHFQQCERLSQRVRQAVESYRLEIRALPTSDEQEPHNQRLHAVEDGLKQLRLQMDWKRLESEPLKSAGIDASLEEGGGPMSLDQAVEIADKTQDASFASVARSKKMVLEAEQVGIATLEKMNAQEEQMMRIGEEMEDAKANIKRSRKLLGQIARSAAKDRCIQVLCALVVIAIMVMVTVAILGKDNGELNVPSGVRQATPPPT